MSGIARCFRCDAPIFWAESEKGKAMPMDSDPSLNGAFRIENRPGQNPLAVFIREADRSREPRLYRMSSREAHGRSESMNNDLSAALDLIVTESLKAGLPLKRALKVIDRRFVEIAITRAGGNMTKAARSLGVHRNSLHNRVRRGEVLMVEAMNVL